MPGHYPRLSHPAHKGPYAPPGAAALKHLGYDSNASLCQLSRVSQPRLAPPPAVWSDDKAEDGCPPIRAIVGHAELMPCCLGALEEPAVAIVSIPYADCFRSLSAPLLQLLLLL